MTDVLTSTQNIYGNNNQDMNVLCYLNTLRIWNGSN